MKLADLCQPRLLLKAAEHHRIRPWYWRTVLAPRLGAMSDAEFLRHCGWNPDPAGAVAAFHERARLRFFFHPRNRKEFFLSTLTSLEPEIDIIRDGEQTLRNEFQTLGSAVTPLGDPIPWQRDFKRGKEWPLRRITVEELVDIGNPSDVKVPWELSRFHQAWWLGKAYWLTGRETYAEKFGALVTDWIGKNPPGLGVNWYVGMEVAIRAANWIAGYAFFCESRSLDTAFWVRFLRSLVTHGHSIANNLEYSRVNGNHYLSDIVGLVYLGTFFQDTPFGARWLATGIAELEREILLQVDPDGVDFEKSTSYHRLVLELFMSAALLCRVNGRPMSPAYTGRLERMLDFVLHYTRPDGSVPLWGDADDGRLFRFRMEEEINDHRHALSTGAVLFSRADFAAAAGGLHEETLWYFGGEGVELFRSLKNGAAPASKAFPDGGVYVMRDDRTHLFIDAGELGQRGRGGHGHNDTLGFTLWHDGAEIFVDPGTYSYTSDRAARQELRSTSSHNTIMVDGAELAVFGGLWHVEADTTSPEVLIWSSDREKDILEAEHHGYRRLGGEIVVRRRFELRHDRLEMRIVDTIRGAGTHRLAWSFHLHPEATVELADPGTAVINIGEVRLRFSSTIDGWSVGEGWYSPSYGVRERSRFLALAADRALPATASFTLERIETGRTIR